MRVSTFIMAFALSAATLASAQQTAQGSPPVAPASIDPRAVVAEVRRVIAEQYVLPERRGPLDEVLAEGLSSGRYDVRDPASLAERINADLARVGRDRHLNFNYNPEQAALLAAPGDSSPPNPEALLRQARAANHGLSEMRVLPGNIRYLAYDGFIWTGPETAAALDHAMRFLAGGEAAIIDLRRNGGGSPAAVQYAISHFLAAGTPLVSFHFSGQPENRLAALDELPAGRMVGKPLYVLTSNGTASAAEEFTGHVGGYRIGELVGETTGGAGFRNILVPIPGGFVLSVSVGRAVLASTGRDWEAVGIAPTISVPVANALEAAQAHALRRIMAQASPGERTRFEALADALDARVQPRSPARPLEAYAGQFGERRLIAESGRLYYQRGERPRVPLIPLGGDRFAFETDPGTQLSFVGEGASAAFDLGPAGGPPQGRYQRTG